MEFYNLSRSWNECKGVLCFRYRTKFLSWASAYSVVDLISRGLSPGRQTVAPAPSVPCPCIFGFIIRCFRIHHPPFPLPFCFFSLSLLFLRFLGHLSLDRFSTFCLLCCNPRIDFKILNIRPLLDNILRTLTVPISRIEEERTSCLT